jgi:cytochrome c-type biogenesis protein CcmH/NrfG
MKIQRFIKSTSHLRFALCAALLSGLVVASLPQAQAAGSESTPSANARINDFTEGKKAIEEKRWDAALEHFHKVVAKDAKNADAHNYMGLAYRWQNRLDESLKAYQRALQLEPKHLGANEYLGQAYLKKGDKALAEAQLNKLKEICSTCKETESLASALAASN